MKRGNANTGYSTRRDICISKDATRTCVGRRGFDRSAILIGSEMTSLYSHFAVLRASSVKELNFKASIINDEVQYE